MLISVKHNNIIIYIIKLYKLYNFMQTSQLQNLVCSVKGVHVQLDVLTLHNAPWDLVIIIIHLIHKNTKSSFL